MKRKVSAPGAKSAVFDYILFQSDFINPSY